VTHHALGGNGGHVFVRAVDPPPPLKTQREGDRVGEIPWIGGRELVGVGHGRP
jgi:hypothetical protein